MSRDFRKILDVLRNPDAPDSAKIYERKVLKQLHYSGQLELQIDIAFIDGMHDAYIDWALAYKLWCADPLRDLNKILPNGDMQ